MNPIGILVIALFIYATVFLFLGPLYLRRPRSIVGRFRTIRRELQNWPIQPARLPDPIEVASFCNTEFLGVSATGTVVGGVDLRHRRLGDIVDIVHFRDDALKRTIRELRVYAFIVLVLGGVGFLRFLRDNNFNPDLFAFFRWIDTHPLEMIAVLEVIMLGALTVRLVVEYMTISDLIQD